MHALGCDAADALRRLRKESQRRHVKVTEVAADVVAANGGQEQTGKRAVRSSGRGLSTRTRSG
jgi:hypothetical protein